MAEESNQDEGAVATETTAVVAAEAESPGEGGKGRKAIPISLDLLTETSKSEIEEQTGKPVKDVPYTVVEEKALPESRVSIRFEVGAEEFKHGLDHFYENLRKDLVLPGFRKGKAPIKLIRIRMGEAADIDAMTETAVNVARQERLKRQFVLVSEPLIVEWSIEDGNPLSFEVEFELQPRIELKEYRGITVDVEANEVTDKDVDLQIERLRSDYATWEEAPEGHAVTEADAVVLDLRVEGEKGNELKNMSRENWFVTDFKRALPEELATKMIGSKAGDTLEVAIKGTRATRRGDEIEFTDTYRAVIRGVKVRKYPELDDEFAKDVGEHETLEALREAIRKDLDAAEENRTKSSAIVNLMLEIIKRNPFDVPKSLVDFQRYQAVLEDSRRLERVGLRLDQVINDPGQYISSKTLTAEAIVKQSYLVAKLAEQENLAVTDEDLDAEIARIAERTGRKPLAVRARLEAEKQLDGFRSELIDKKIGDFLIANNTVNKVAPAPEPAAASEESSAVEPAPGA